MDIFKDYIFHLLRETLEDPCIIIHDSIWPKLKLFIQMLLNIKFEDGKYHLYYGTVKEAVSCFMIYYKVTMDETIKEADRSSHVLEKDELMYLMDNTISVHQSKRIDFAKEYLPVKSRKEKENYEEIEKKYEHYIEQLYELKDKIEKFDKKFKVDEFIKDHFDITLKKMDRLFTYSQSYIAMILADNVDKIRISLEEILLRMKNNLKRETEAATERQTKLWNELYDKNKEHLAINRRYRNCSIESAEVLRSIQILREKIENCESSNHLQRLKEEVDFWLNIMKDFHEVADVIYEIKKEQGDCVKQEGIYEKLVCTELPGSKLNAWENIGATYKGRQAYLKEKMVEAAKKLLTFFTCKGSDRICYTDIIGRYYIDEFNHQVYPFDYALNIYHRDCEGKFRECPDTDLYYFDERGRYILKDGEKVYQCAPCTSEYKLGDDGLLKKITKDCGHSERLVDTCQMEVKDPTIIEYLPTTVVKDIKKTLDSDVVKYLWDSVGGLLPDALYDVGMAKPINPIHILAHKLLWHKYNRTVDEVQQKTKEAQKYRDDVFKKRLEKATLEARAWKSKQVKRRKPEESDDAQDMAVFAAQQAQMDFINSLDYYN